mgnify:FL=1
MLDLWAEKGFLFSKKVWKHRTPKTQRTNPLRADGLPATEKLDILLSDIILTVEGVDPVELFGENNAKLNLLRKAFSDATITSRGNSVKISGDKKDTQAAKAKFEMMVRYLREHQELPVQTVEDLLGGENPFEVRIPVNGDGSNGNTILFGRDGKPIKAKTRNQKRMIEVVDTNDIVFALGPAGDRKSVV